MRLEMSSCVELLEKACGGARGLTERVRNVTVMPHLCWCLMVFVRWADSGQSQPSQTKPGLEASPAKPSQSSQARLLLRLDWDSLNHWESGIAKAIIDASYYIIIVEHGVSLPWCLYLIPHHTRFYYR
jgi:hypothetical protein